MSSCEILPPFCFKRRFREKQMFQYTCRISENNANDSDKRLWLPYIYPISRALVYKIIN